VSVHVADQQFVRNCRRLKELENSTLVLSDGNEAQGTSVTISVMCIHCSNPKALLGESQFGLQRDPVSDSYETQTKMFVKADSHIPCRSAKGLDCVFPV
jgi:hypothetical protein